MALTIEDGTGLAAADSFATVAEARTFATNRGLTLPEDDADVEVLLRKAADFLIGIEDRFQGQRSTSTQRLPFPRYDVLTPGGYALNSNAIPDCLKDGQIQLAVDGNTTALRPNGTGREVVREKVGALEKQYNPTGGNSVDPVFNAAMDLLKPIFKQASARVFRG